MSFILDALKKSESDRQRQSGPALFEVKVAPPRTYLPPWAIAIAALLIVNLGIVLWMVMRHSSRPPAGADGTAATSSAASASVPASSATPPPAAGAPATAPAAAAPAGAAPLTALTSAPAPAGNAAAAAPPANSAPTTAGGGAPGAALPPAGANPDDYTPAEDAPAAPPSGPFSGRVRRGTAAGVPLYQDAAATPGTQIPQLRLDLHVFAVRVQDRFVMINMHKAHEGDTLPEGVHVDSITPEGAVLSYNGSRFLLPRE